MPIVPGDVIAIPKLPESVHTNDILSVPEAVDEEVSEIQLETDLHLLTPPSAVPQVRSSQSVTLGEENSDNLGPIHPLEHVVTPLWESIRQVWTPFKSLSHKIS